jgi:hypothetical protein
VTSTGVGWVPGSGAAPVEHAAVTAAKIKSVKNAVRRGISGGVLW